jgi:isopentenyl-diphosphate delta-isomerase
MAVVRVAFSSMGKPNGLERVVLVDPHDREIGSGDRYLVHTSKMTRHRGLSVFVFNSEGSTLLQRRSELKLLWPLHWSNTCCTHPLGGTSIVASARQRLGEEMGFQCELVEAFGFEYTAKYKDVGGEHEYDHVLIGQYEGNPTPNPLEVADWRWASEDEIRSELAGGVFSYTPWFIAVWERVFESWLSNRLEGRTPGRRRSGRKGSRPRTHRA